MNILHTFEAYGDTSGARILKAISEALVRRGHRVTVLTGGPKRPAETIGGVTVHRFPISGNQVRGIRGGQAAIAEYQNCIVKSGADIILNYAAQSWATDLVFPLLSKIAGKKIFLPCGYSRLGSLRYGRYFAELPRYLLQYDHIVYLSQNYADKQFGDRCGANLSGRYSVISNCADPAEFLPDSPESFRRRFGITTRHLVVNVTHHYLYKNHAMLWQLAKFLHAEDVTFALVGNPSLPSWRGCYYSCRARQLFYPNVRLFPRLPRPLVVSAMKEADLMVLTSTYECDPIVMYEAFAAKTPLVSMPVGSVPEFADYVRLGQDVSDMAAQVIRLLNYEPSRREMAERAFRLWQERYTLPRIVDQYINLYEKLANA